MESYAKSVDEVVEEIMRIHRSLPPRPGIEEVEGAKILIRNAESEEQARLEAISRRKKGKEVPDELFNVLIEMQKHLVCFNTMEQKREAVKLLELERYHQLFDEMIQRASRCVDPSGGGGGDNDQPTSSGLANSASFTGANFSSNSLSTATATPTSSTFSLYYDKEPVKTTKLFTRDDSYVTKSESSSVVVNDGIGRMFRSSDTSRPAIVDSTLKPAIASGEILSSLC